MPDVDADTHVLAVAGGKGGCGKTTTTLGVALAAARLGRSVLAVDADVDVPDLHRLAGVEASGGPGGESGDADREPRPIPGAASASVLPARPGEDPRAVADRLAVASDGQDLALVDCPAGAGPDVACPLRVADVALLVTTPTPQALGDTAKTAAMTRAVGTPVAGAVVTGADQVPDGTGRLLGTDQLWAVPRADDPLQSPGPRRQYEALARQMTEVTRPQAF